MVQYQKLAALIIRLIGFSIIGYNTYIFVLGVLFTTLPLSAYWSILFGLLLGVILFKAALPIARFIAKDLDD